MAVIRKTRTGKYMLDFRANGERRRPLFQSRAEAEAAKRELLLGYASGSPESPLKPKLIKDAFRFYFDTESKRKVSGHNEQAYFDRMFKFLRSHGLMMIHEVGAIHIDQFKSLRSQDVMPSTVNREFNTYRHFFNKCVDWEATTKNPFDKIENLPAKKNPRRVWTDAEFQIVMSKLPSWAQDFLSGLYWLGAGPSELARLTWGDIDFEKRIVLLKRYKGSGDEIRRHIPIPQEFASFLEAKRSEARRGFRVKLADRVFLNSKKNQVDPRVFAGHVRRAVLEGELPAGTVPYGIRHKFGTELLEADVGEEKVRKLMGHRSVRTLIENYAHVKDSSLRSAMEVRAGQASNLRQQTLKKQRG